MYTPTSPHATSQVSAHNLNLEPDCGGKQARHGATWLARKGAVLGPVNWLTRQPEMSAEGVAMGTTRLLALSDVQWRVHRIFNPEVCA